MNKDKKFFIIEKEKIQKKYIKEIYMNYKNKIKH